MGDRRSSVRAEMKTALGIIISERIVRRRLHGTGFKGRVTRKKPHVDKANRAKPIQYIEISLLASGIKCCGPMKVNLTCLGHAAS